MPNKIKISQAEFDSNYEINNNYEIKTEITGENLEVPSAKQDDTTPILNPKGEDVSLTEEEIKQNDEYLKDLISDNIEEEELA